MGHLGGGIDRPLSRRVVHRGVPEAADGQGVGLPLGLDVQLASCADGEGDAEGARELRRDRRGLRDHGEVGVAEDLVPTAGDRLVGGGKEALEDVLHAVVSGDLLGAGQVEPARAVVQQRRVIGTESGGDEGVGLVACRADRVEAASQRTEPAGGVIEVAAGHLGVEEHVEASPRERRTWRHRVVRHGRRRSSHADRRHGVEQLRLGLVELVAIVEAADALPAHGTDITVDMNFGTGTPSRPAWPGNAVPALNGETT